MYKYLKPKLTNVPVHHLKGHHDRSTNPIKRNLGVKIAGLKNLILLTVMLGLWKKYRYSGINDDIFSQMILVYAQTIYTVLVKSC